MFISYHLCRSALGLLLTLHLAPELPNAQYKQPQVAVTRDLVALTFGSGNTVYFSGSSDQGKNFSRPVKVAENTKLALGMHRGPRIAIAPAAIVISAVVHNANGADGDLVAWTSRDGGKSWSPGVIVNDVSTSAREGLHGMAAAPDGTLFAAWLDDRSIDGAPRRKQLFGAASRDGGATWSKNVMIYHSPEEKICECCHPSVAFDSKGRLEVMWRNNLKGMRDMYLVQSTDGGRTFSQAEKLGEGSWLLNACPMDGGGVAVDGKGSVATVWRRQDTVYLDSPGKPESVLGKGKNAALATNDDGVYAAWSGPQGLVAKIPGRQEPILLAEDGTYVSVGASGSLAIAAWESKGGVGVQNLGNVYADHK